MITPFRIGWLFLSLTLFTLMGYGLIRQQFNLLILLYGLAFWGYVRITRPLWSIAQQPVRSPIALPEPDRFLFLAAVLFRVSLLAVIPNLSDDYARFVWDGHLVANGYNPYLSLPSQIIHTPLATAAGLTESLYTSLNSPDYFTVYPPVNQALFGLAAWLFPHNLLGNLIALRFPILLAEVGIVVLLPVLLRRFGKNPNLALLYVLNPLVILELTGNVHFEAVMIFFVLLAVWLFVQERRLASSMVLALGIATKLLPLLFFPLLIRYIGWKRGLAYGSLTLVLTAVLFFPFIDADLIRNLFSSLHLYFQKFEFNAGIYYLIRTVGYVVTGNSIIVESGIVLSILIVIGTLMIAFGDHSFPALTSVATRMLLTMSLYWLLATTVHPWYLTSLVAITVFTPFRYPLIWSGLAILSYGAYRTFPYNENLQLVGLEYVILFLYGLYEWRQAKRAIVTT
ncbi:DUF2029 domain-containing protein [Spirosoma knui]